MNPPRALALVCRLFAVAILAAVPAVWVRAAADTPPAPGSGRAGRFVHIDPATGERARPGAGTRSAVGALPPPAVPRSALVQRAAAGGGVGVELEGNFRSYSVATLSGDGRVRTDCFTGREAAQAAVAAGAKRAHESAPR